MSSDISSSVSQQQQQLLKQQQQQQQLPRIVGTSGLQKILKTKVKLCGRFLLEAQQEFNLQLAGELVRKATVEHKLHLHTTLKLFNLGVRLGENGVFASMPAEFIRYQRIVGFISLRENSKTLAICLRNQQQRSVTILQFKDEKALSVVCDVINRQRRLLADVDFGADSDFGDSANQNWTLTDPQQQQQQQQQEQQVVSTGGMSFSEEYAVVRRHSSGSSNGQQQQQQQQQQVQVHTETRLNGAARRDSIEVEILNYDEVETKTAATDVSELKVELRQQQQRHQQQRHSASSRVVTSASSGNSDLTSAVVSPKSRSLELQYRTSTIIYRGSSMEEQQQQQQQQQRLSGNYQQLQMHQQQQPMQLMRLVPVGSARRPRHHHRHRHHQHQQQQQQQQQQFFTLQPVAGDPGIYMTAGK